ncbi:MAG: DUF6497 family protein [Deltaproteobacteria bacterium]
MADVTTPNRTSRTLVIGVAFGVIVGLGALTFWFLNRDPACCEAPNSPLIAVPSGQAIYYVDTISNIPGQEGLTYRFRFIAPAINRERGTMTAESSADDLLELCNTFAVPRLPATGPVPNQIIISLADRDVPFGQAAPQATQFFEAFKVDAGTCIWQLF